MSSSSPLWVALKTEVPVPGSRQEAERTLDFERVMAVLQTRPDVNERRQDGQTPLLFLVRHPSCFDSFWSSHQWGQHQQLHHRLLELGASVALPSDYQGGTLLAEGLAVHFSKWYHLAAGRWIVQTPKDVTQAMAELAPWVNRAKTEMAPETWGAVAAKAWGRFLEVHGHREQERMGPQALGLAEASLRLFVAAGAPLAAFSTFPSLKQRDYDVLLQPLVLAHQRLLDTEPPTAPTGRRRLRS